MKNPHKSQIPFPKSIWGPKSASNFVFLCLQLKSKYLKIFKITWMCLSLLIVINSVRPCPTVSANIIFMRARTLKISTLVKIWLMQNFEQISNSTCNFQIYDSTTTKKMSNQNFNCSKWSSSLNIIILTASTIVPTSLFLITLENYTDLHTQKSLLQGLSISFYQFILLFINIYGLFGHHEIDILNSSRSTIMVS